MSIFDTTANQNFNAFADPFNPINMNQGMAGINPSYLTPSYTAPYRQPYMGATPHVANQNPGFFRSMYNLSPTGPGTPYGVGNQQQDSAYYDSIGSRPMDFGMSAMQRVGVPLLAIGGAYAFSNAMRMGSTAPWQYGRKAQAAWNYTWGASEAGAVAATRTVGLGTAMGQRGAMGLMQGLIGGASRFAPGIAESTAARVAIGGATILGGMAGGIAFPLMAAQGLMTAADKFAFDPYVGVRENQNMLRQSFSGVTFGEPGVGDPYTGRGLSRASSARIGSQLAQTGMKDQVFNSREIASLTSIASQTGLLDNVSSDQLSKRMEGIVKQLKVVMSITGSTDFKDTMSMIARMQMAGASPGQIGGLMTQIGGLASAAGISTGRMMSTVGAQGQYLFQANGLTPMLGQLTAATSMAGFSSAFRTGLISPEMMARMGGVEGATQLSVTAQVNGAQTIYNMMRNFNRYTSRRGETGDVIGNVSRFGQTFASDPLESYGAMIAGNARAMSQRFADEGGIMATHNQIMEIAGITPGAIRGGRLSGNRAVAVMKQMNLTDDQINAFMSEYAARKNPKSVQQLMAGINSSEITTVRDLLEQSGQTKFAAMVSPVSAAYRGLRGDIARGMGLGVEGMGGLTDLFSNIGTSFTVGSPEQLRSRNINDYSGKISYLDTNLSYGAKGQLRKLGAKTGRLSQADQDVQQYGGIMSRINELAKQGNVDAITAIKSRDRVQVANALNKLSGPYIDPKYGDALQNDELTRAIMGARRGSEEDVASDITKRYQDALSGASGLFNKDVGDTDKVKGFNIARDLEGLMVDGKLDRTDEVTAAKISELQRLTGKSYDTDARLKGGVEGLYTYASKNRIGREYGQLTAGGVYTENANVTIADRVHIDRAMEGYEKQRQMINKVFKEGKIDAASWFSANSGIDMSKAVTMFGQYVGQFGNAVGNIGVEVKPGASPSGYNGNPTLNIPN